MTLQPACGSVFPLTSSNKGLFPDMIQNRDSQQQTIWQNTLCINSGLHNLWTRQPSIMARAKLTIPCPGSGTCHQKGGTHAWQRPRSLSDVGCFQTSHHTRPPALTSKYHW